ncbi:Leucine-rich repeat protein kinase family protein, putative [Theobroma cacao]|uniref:non-specific serine/threonine protein kinase n=1 Tax=Theobroma cacao TaxID=3641 RepID=A0A061EQY9_THECC|nr:Leucine-rich repeat protein kinase family protein, putative [Theobroma cacao]
MSNGSLYQWLHPGGNDRYQTKKLSLIQRLDIAIDVASALDYLHHQCETPIVHCDLKPSNLLLDENMTAHVGDFRLARFLFDSSDNPSSNQTISIKLKGSIGYIPPEYGIGGQASIHGDIYSYGILLLEMFTGKSPTDDMFKDDQSLHNFVEVALPEHVMDVVDLSMLSEEENAEETELIMMRKPHPRVSAASMVEEFVVPVMKMGLSCSAASPTERMIMTFVVNKLNDIKDRFLKLKRNNERRMRRR